jgi:Uma2 family endonuclease
LITARVIVNFDAESYTVAMSQPAPAVTSAERPLPDDDIIVLRSVTWADYQRLLEIRGDRSVPRLTYLEGVLELMTPSQPHEVIKSMIGRLVEGYCMEKGIGITPYGSWTHERKEADRGIEPDECYVIGDDPEPQRSDLAIEVEWTRGAINKLEVYQQLQVEEVWVWRKKRIEIFVLREGNYTPAKASTLLPEIDLDLLVRFIEVRPMTRAVTEYRATLKTSSSA